MIITITGTPGSGKSTIAKLLGKKLNHKVKSGGDMFRQVGKERGMSITELNKYMATEQYEDDGFPIDIVIDNKLKQFAEKEKDVVIVSRTAFDFLPNSIKIFLNVDEIVGAERIFKHKRVEEKASDVNELIKNIREREKYEKERYKKVYKIDITDKNNYDLVIDTTKLSIEEVLKEILKFIK